MLITDNAPSDSGFLPSVRQRDHFQRLLCLRFVDVGQLVFRRGKDHGDRLDLRDGDDAGLRRGIDDVADVDLAQAGDAGDRRLDGGVVELGLRVEDGGVVGRDLRGELRHRGALGVGLLPGGEFAELCEALQIQIGVGEVGLVLLLLGLGLIERGLERPGVDLGEQVALFDRSPSLKAILSIWPSTRVRTTTVLKPCTVPSPVRKTGKSAFSTGSDGDRNGGIARRGRLLRVVGLRRLAP